MAFVNGGSNSKTTTKPGNSSILQKLKQARAEQEAERNETYRDNSNTSTKFVKKKLLKSEVSNSSSSSLDAKLQLIKRSTMQEKLFATECHKSRQNFKNHRSRFSNTDSSSDTVDLIQKSRIQGNSKHVGKKLNGYNRNHNNNTNNNNNNNNNNSSNTNNHKNNDYNDDDNDDYDYGCINCENDEDDTSEDEGVKVGVLHLKKPLQLSNNDDLDYFNGRNKIKPIDWSMINGETSKKNKNKDTCKDIRKNIYQARELEQVTDAISIDNSDFFNFVTNSTANNTVYRVHHNLKDTISSATESPIIKIQKAINQCKADAVMVSQDIRLAFERLEQEPKLMDFIDREPRHTSRPHNLKNDVHCKLQEVQKKNMEEFKSRQLKQESVNIVSNSNRMAERKKMIEEYDDDMIGFVKPNSSSSASSLSCRNLDQNVENLDPKHVNRKLFEKFNSSSDSRVRSSLDSDDVSTEKNSELAGLSASTKINNSKFLTLRNRLCNVSTQTSPEKKNIIIVNDNLNSKSIDKINVNNIIKDKTETEVERSSIREEPLIKPVLTRYFSKSSKEESISNESKSEFTIKQNIMPITETEFFPNEIKICYEECTAKDVNDENEQIVSNSEEIKEIYKNECVNSSYEESILNIADNIKNDQNSDNITISICEKKNSIENSKLNNESDVQSQLPLVSTKEENNLTGCEDINSDDEYDIVNYEQFPVFNSLLNKLQAVANAQKEHALGIINELNNNDFNVNNSQNQLKAIEYSSLDSSSNSFSSVNGSVSSNLESDNENASNSSSSSNLLLRKRNIFENIQINIKQLSNYCSTNDDNDDDDDDVIPTATKIKNETKGANQKAVMSAKQQKKVNVLKNDRKSKDTEGEKEVAQNNGEVQIPNTREIKNETKGVNQKTVLSAKQQRKVNALKNYCKSKDTEGEKEVAQNNDEVQKESLKTTDKRNQILEEIKKRKLHLNCKMSIA